jgi:hypothetical protein
LNPVAQAEFGEHPADVGFTVASASTSRAVISAFDRPSGTSMRTSCSREVSSLTLLS